MGWYHASHHMTPPVLQVHTNGRVKPEGSPSYAGDILIRAYNAMLKSALWQRNNGSDFIFYDPHPGFADGAAESQFLDIMCNAARSSIHIVAETGQRNTCQVSGCPSPASHGMHSGPALKFWRADISHAGSAA